MRCTAAPTSPFEPNGLADSTRRFGGRRRPAARLTAVGVAGLLTLAACGGGGGDSGVASLQNTKAAGGGSTSTTLSKEDQEQALLDWVECMRGEGLDIADPTVDADGNLVLGGGPGGARPSGGDTQADPPDRDAIQTATKKCGSPPVNAGGNFSQEDRDAFQQSALLLAQCMRDEGITDFADPDFSNAGPGAGPPADSSNGSPPRGPFGDVDLQDPDVQAALSTCQAKLADQGVNFPGGGGPQSGATDAQG